MQMAPLVTSEGDTFRVVHGAKMLGGVLAIAAVGLWQDWQ
jgi:hypothetical protein